MRSSTSPLWGGRRAQRSEHVGWGPPPEIADAISTSPQRGRGKAPIRHDTLGADKHRGETMENGITRRALAPLAAGAALVSTASCAPGVREPKPVSRQFPHDFKWGAATSAFQIEGALDVDGRGPSIWDVFQSNPKNIIDQSTAAVAADSYRRYKDDVALLSGAGLNSYRFSIAWPRVLPTGGGQANEKGLDYYSRLTDALLEA